MGERRYDVIFEESELNCHGEPGLDYHFCREWEGNKGCYGTNPNHGLTFEEARNVIMRYFEQRGLAWRDMTEAQWRVIYDPSEEEPAHD